MSQVPSELQYSPEHEWVDLDGDVATVGVTAYAAEQLGDVVYLALPSVGDALRAGAVFGEIESTKSVSELFSPVDGEVIEVNTAMVDDPEAVNRDAYASWLIRARVTGTVDLLSADAYRELIGD